MKRFSTLFCLLLLCSMSLLAQEKNDSLVVKAKPEKSIQDMGFDFFIGAGIYKGAKANAGYYSGIPENENNLDYIFNNYYWKQDIVDLIVKNNSYVSYSDSTIAVKEYPGKMRYSPSMAVQLGFTYKFSKNWGMTFSYSFSRCVVKDFFTVRYDNAIPGNERNDYLLYGLVGKENRSFFDLSARYTFHPSKIVKPFIEIGAQFNYVKVQSFDAIIEDQKFSLLDIYGGESYVPGASMQTFKVIYGGPGFGFCADVGLKIVCSPTISIDPLFYVSVSKFGLKGYNDFGLNWGAFVRIIMNDSFLTR